MASLQRPCCVAWSTTCMRHSNCSVAPGATVFSLLGWKMMGGDRHLSGFSVCRVGGMSLVLAGKESFLALGLDPYLPIPGGPNLTGGSGCPPANHLTSLCHCALKAQLVVGTSKHSTGLFVSPFVNSPMLLFENELVGSGSSSGPSSKNKEFTPSYLFESTLRDGRVGRLGLSFRLL